MMKQHRNRREFLATSLYAAAGCVLGVSGRRCESETFKQTLHKALIVGKPTAAVLQPIKDAGFAGVEAGVVSPADAAKARKEAEGLEMRIHSVLRGWAKFNSDKPDEVEHSLGDTVTALRVAQEYGADDILLVPGRINVKPMPEPWEFDVRFEQKTGHLTAVVKEDNDRYRDYMAAHDHAYDAFQAAIRKLIPVAAETGVVIAVENVWNNLFVDPRHMAHFIDSFKSQWVKAYFDTGNCVRYSPPEEWIRILGKRTVKVHVKDFKLNADGRGGKFVDIRDGSVNWPLVRKALEDVGYDGWMTIEGSRGLSMEEKSKRLDMIIAGE